MTWTMTLFLIWMNGAALLSVSLTSEPNTNWFSEAIDDPKYQIPRWVRIVLIYLILMVIVLMWPPILGWKIGMRK